MTTENWIPEPDPNRDRSMPLWPTLPVVAVARAGAATPSGAAAKGGRRHAQESRPWARRLATVAAAAVLSLGGGAVLGAAAVRLETDTVAVAEFQPGSASGPDAVGVTGTGVSFGAASVVVARLWS